MRATKWANTLFSYKDATYSALLDSRQNSDTLVNLQRSVFWLSLQRQQKLHGYFVICKDNLFKNYVLIHSIQYYIICRFKLLISEFYLKHQEKKNNKQQTNLMLSFA